ncbi:MAG: hypothetical protein EOP83_07825 [Verrucomicrobiaceae bacterium]|nr:MAG: hypothetical protein EOP83_07825 [Verrucomicrobiaceae bacterium]
MIENLKGRFEWLTLMVKNKCRVHSVRVNLWRWKRRGYTVIEVKENSPRYEKLMLKSTLRVIVSTNSAVQAVQTVKLQPEIYDWLGANLTEGFCKIRNEPNGRLYFVFEGANDALSFKMRWF